MAFTLLILDTSKIKYPVLAILTGAAAFSLIFYFPGRSIEVRNDPIRGSFTEVPVGLAPGASKISNGADIGPQKQMAEPPKVVKGIYLTGWSAGNESNVQEVLNLAREGKINAVIIDIKDFSGETFLFPRPNALLKRLHDEDIYVIARLAVFQDQVLAKARPELGGEKHKIVGKCDCFRRFVAGPQGSCLDRPGRQRLLGLQHQDRSRRLGTRF